MSILKDADRAIIPLILEGRLDVATEWYIGMTPTWYQYAYHYAPQSAVTIVSGIATGKTTIGAMSNLMKCISTPYYRALNTSVTAKQAELSFDMFHVWYEDNPRLEHLIKDMRLRPYPAIVFQNYAEWDFRTAGTDARFIRGSEYDRIIFDEAGLDPFGEVPKVLRTRLRGKRPISPTMNKMVNRDSRLDVITSPTDSMWLKERFDKGFYENPSAELDKYFSIRVTTYDNPHLTTEQVGMMESELSQEDIAVELRGEFPNYGMTFFPKGHIDAITNVGRYIYDELYEAVYPETGSPKDGYSLDEHARYGITKYELPFKPGHTYVMAGDPGTDDPPKRNAGVVLVADVTTYPCQLVYFDWVAGHGSYEPFLSSYKYALRKYAPVRKGLDTTGPQKAMQELAFERHDIETDGINFSSDKEGMLNALSLMITNQEIIWLPARGLIKQMSTYSREMDKKIPQDIVMTLAMIAYLARYVSSDSTDSTPKSIYSSRKLRSAGSFGRFRR